MLLAPRVEIALNSLLRKHEELALLAVKNPSGATDSEEQLRCSEEWLRHREERALRARRDGGKKWFSAK